METYETELSEEVTTTELRQPAWTSPVRPAASVVMTTYNRPQLLEKTLESLSSQTFKNFEVIVVDDGSDAETEPLCAHSVLPVRYFKRQRKLGTYYSNPSVPNNIGIRYALGDLIILQNAECLHYSPEVVKSFVDQTAYGTALFATVEAMDVHGQFEQWYIHPMLNRRPFFFCGALHRDFFLELRGFDENFLFYGYDDNQFSDRLAAHGVKFEFSKDILVKHQWHGSSYKVEDLSRNKLNEQYYNEWTAKFKAGIVGVEVNVGQEWGEL